MHVMARHAVIGTKMVDAGSLLNVGDTRVALPKMLGRPALGIPKVSTVRRQDRSIVSLDLLQGLFRKRSLPKALLVSLVLERCLAGFDDLMMLVAFCQLVTVALEALYRPPPEPFPPLPPLPALKSPLPPSPALPPATELL